jgi:hypothetical protein
MLYVIDSYARRELEYERELAGERSSYEADVYQAHLEACRRRRQDFYDAIYDERCQLSQSYLKGGDEERLANQDMPEACQFPISN